MLRSYCMLVAAIALSSAAGASAPTKDIQYGGVAKWALPPPAPTSTASPAEAPLRFIYADSQIHTGSQGIETFTQWRVKILKPEALALGNISVTWSADSGSATVHRLNIIRDGKSIDVLKTSKFQVIEREGGLEKSILDGQLTATLQVPGLQVGDEMEFAATVRQRDLTLGDHVFGANQLPVQGTSGVFRFRLEWPSADPVVWRGTKDIPAPAVLESSGQNSITYELRDPSGVIVTDGAPPRYNVRRIVEYSDFKTWQDVSKRFWPLFADASKLSADSPLRAEVAKIAAASPDPTLRAQAALRLVQDQIRYVYVALDGGNFKPATIDETWARRFGDCKAKTVVLLALLKELGIEAEPVLVNIVGSDGTDERLPSPAVFNHILVRAKIGGSTYWLDGTRTGDRYLDTIPEPAFKWALPVTEAGGDLEAVLQRPLKTPQLVSVLDIDATGGFDKPAKVKAQNVLRQDEAYASLVQLKALSAEDADRAVKAYWRQQMDWVEPSQVSWTYDERHAALVLSLTGEGKPEWTGDDKQGRSLTILGAGLYPPDLRRRPKEQDQTAPWATNFPRFRCWATTIRLPTSDPKWAWTYYADPMNLRLGGTAYWRAAGLKGNVMRTVMSTHIYLPELTATQAADVNAAIPTFNNNMSSVSQASVHDAKTGYNSQTLPYADGVDWVTNDAACSAPGQGLTIVWRPW